MLCFLITPGLTRTHDIGCKTTTHTHTHEHQLALVGPAVLRDQCLPPYSLFLRPSTTSPASCAERLEASGCKQLQSAGVK